MRAALGLDRCHLLGQSWGGWLAIEYMARGPAGIERLVLASTSASIPQFMAEARKLIEALPEPHRSVLIDLGAKGEYDHPDYQAAVEEFYRRHLCRSDPWPEALVRSSEQMDGNQVYLTMNGPTEFDVIGRLREWDRTADLSRITRADARHVRPLRRDHARLLRDDHPRHPGRAHARVRAKRAHRAPRGGRGLRGARRGVPLGVAREVVARRAPAAYGEVMDPTPAADGSAAPATARWWLLLVAAAACTTLYLGSTVSAYLLSELGGRTLIGAVRRDGRDRRALADERAALVPARLPRRRDPRRDHRPRPLAPGRVGGDRADRVPARRLAAAHRARELGRPPRHDEPRAASSPGRARAPPDVDRRRDRAVDGGGVDARLPALGPVGAVRVLAGGRSPRRSSGQACTACPGCSCRSPSRASCCAGSAGARARSAPASRCTRSRTRSRRS